MAMTEKQVLALQLTPFETVRRYARENYTKGWDCVVEAVNDEDLLALLGDKPISPASALKRAYQTYVKPYLIHCSEQAAEIDPDGGWF